MLSPTADDQAYLDAIPAFLEHSELRVPAFISLETPFPGTPYFERLASMPNALLPNALLRDFSGYTLVVKPQKLPGNALLDGYRQLIDRVYAWPARLKKVATDAPRLLASGGWDAALLGGITTLGDNYRADPGRTYIGGTDRAPPERVPFSDGDFASQHQRAALLEPWAVTDHRGVVLPQWLSSGPVYGKRGVIITQTPAAQKPATAGLRDTRREPLTPPFRPDHIPAGIPRQTTPERMSA
jgi:hypothetical protein